MFIQSVIEGIKAIFDWHILLGMAGVSIVSVGFITAIGAMMTAGSESTEGARTGAGCLLYALGGPVIQALSVGFFILLLLPALLGDGGFTPAEVVGALSGSLVKVTFLSLLVVLILCFIPGFGKLISDTPGVITFMIGIFIMKPLISRFYKAVTDQKIPSEVFPGFFACVGYVIVGIILCYALFVVLALVRDQMKRRSDPVGHMMEQYGVGGQSGNMQLVGLLVGPAIGLIPLLMYAKYVALKLQEL